MAKIVKRSTNRTRVAVGLKASTIRRLIRSGYTIGQIAEQYGTTRMTLYRRFGDEIRGLSGHGARRKG